jgi:hypothetical protein
MKKSRHNLSNERMLSCDIGQLVPCAAIPVLPGDEFRANSKVMVRLSPMAAPVMHGISIRVHHFFVPDRLTWPDGHPSTFEDFITGGPDGNDASVTPKLNTTGTAYDLLDYMGLPVGGSQSGIPVMSTAVRAFNLIYNEWYRDQDLITERTLEDLTIPNVAYGRDYYNTARPWPQKGEEVTLPLGDRAPVVGIGVTGQGAASGPTTVYETDGTGGTTYEDYYDTTGSRPLVEADPDNVGFPGIFADLSQATAATINALRRASGLQRFAEARARWGSRYAEYTRHAFGAVPLDARIQRPEFLGGGTNRVSISEVLQTAPESTGRDFGVGDMYGHGIGMAKSNRYKTRFQEHGMVISMFSVRPNPMYSNGIERHFLKNDREDFYQRELAHIGQQEVLEQEVYADSTNSGNVFGWNDRYAEYRHARSMAVAEFRDVLDYWHLARKFSTAPALNQAFVEVTPADTKRIFNEQTNHSLWVFCDHQVQARRVVPKNATARLL